MEHVMKKYFDDIVDSTVDIVKFDSSLKPAEGEYPFGKETADCLRFFLSLAESFGFETHNYDDYVGEVVFGVGEDFAVLAHLDVVPVGNGWKYPPFGGVINDDISDNGVTGKKIWGRGTIDDKTPAIICLYALKALKDEGYVPQRTIKLIVGCNEEAGWKCIDHYNEVATMPEEGFTPDACFPVIYAEKGILHFTAKFPMENPPFTALSGGASANMVCDLAHATLTKQAGAKLVGYENPIQGTTLSYDNTTNILTVRGKSAHGSTPWQGANALEALFAFFASFDEDCKKIYDSLFKDSAGLRTLEDETGPLTCSPDIAVVTDKLDSLGVEYAIDSHKEALYNAPDGELISTLAGVYASITGEDSKPIAIGGGTYARALKRGCGFGPDFPDDEGLAHQPNEFITFEKIERLSEIYYEALKAVSKPKKYIRIGYIKKLITK